MSDPIEQYLITGGNSQLGMELVKQLGSEASISKAHEVLDVSNLKQVREIVPLLRPAAVIHTAAVTDWVTAENDQCTAWNTNVRGTDNLVKVCALSGTPLVVVSCDSVFGANRNRQPRRETDPVDPINYLGITKMAAEHAVLRLAQCYCPEFWNRGFRYWVIRTGPLLEATWRHTRHLAQQIARLSTSRRDVEVPLVSDMTFSPTYVPHLAKALIWLVKNYREMPSGVYHVANRGACSAFQFGMELSANSNKVLRICPSSREEMAQAFGGWDAKLMPYNSALDSSKFNDVCPCPLPTWQEGVEEYSFACQN